MGNAFSSSPSREEIRFTDFLHGIAHLKLRDFIYRISEVEGLMLDRVLRLWENFEQVCRCTSTLSIFSSQTF